MVNGESFGDWKGTVRPIQQGVRITDLDGRWRFSRFQGSVDWTEDRGEHYTRYNGSLGSDDLARSLSAWGLPEMIEAEEAAARVSLGWNDWPLSPDYLALEGQARVDIGECRIPDTDTRTSFLRVLGILNLGTIQRRLRLDFSDLYKKGLSCDSISGDFIINGSRVSTSNFAIDSPSAAIRVKGAIDLEKQTLDHQMEVTLPLSSNLYAGCLAGPAACAGIFVVERIWGDKLDKTATMEYSVTGNWANPKVSETEGIFGMSQSIAAIQMTSGREPHANLAAAEPLLQEAAGRGARLAVLPENFAGYGGGLSGAGGAIRCPAAMVV